MRGNAVNIAMKETEIFWEIKVKKKAQLILFVILLKSPTEAHTITGSLPEINGVLGFLQSVISPYITSLRSNDVEFRSKKENLVEKTIRDKVESLKLYLQDDDDENNEDDDNDNDLTLQGKDETTIIEFVSSNPKGNLRNNEKTPDPLKENVDKYKKIRKKIKSALKKEKVSEKSSSLVTNTLDEMIAKILENKCSWKSSIHNTSKTHINDRAARANEIAHNWNTEWATLRDLYIKSAKKNAADKFPAAKIYLFFEQFHEFLGHIAQDVETMAGKYKVVCEIVDQQKPQTSTNDAELRMGGNKTGVTKKKHKCEHFMVCTEELTKFLTNFYYALNDSAVSTLRNYAWMYVRDVTTDDSLEKENVITVLGNVGDLIEYKVSKIFRKETDLFELDKDKKSDENVGGLRDYVKRTVENVKKYIKSTLDIGLRSLRARLLSTIKQDLNVNLNVDLGNLERDFKGRICTVFSLCNGRYVGRRNMGKKENSDMNSVYVKVQMTLDDALKEKLVKKHFSIVNNQYLTTTSNNDVHSKLKEHTMLDTDKSDEDVKSFVTKMRSHELGKKTYKGVANWAKGNRKSKLGSYVVLDVTRTTLHNSFTGSKGTTQSTVSDT